MRRAAHHTDANHAQIVKALRDAGIAVKSLAGVGGGFPDLICALREVTVLLEIKNPERSHHPEERKATLEFIATWPGKAFIVHSPEEAVSVVVEAARPIDRCRHGERETRRCAECATEANWP